ncbi:hypothetical protein DPMN_000941 [Dreissena polymorpha]|uniref:Uncharacterized protein n=1 Tax=Dreissena polymorpha TaxID=45954 RepID=A0A9D4MGU2_DREPO|nr:hypothetical protein DPMN_000941 [Dreissena polymorpha]
MTDAFAEAGGFTTQFPYLLPTRSHFTTLIITDAHCSQLHAGVLQTVTHIRQNTGYFDSPASQGYFKEMYYVLEDQQQTLQSAYLPSTSERQSF